MLQNSANLVLIRVCALTINSSEEDLQILYNEIQKRSRNNTFRLKHKTWIGWVMWLVAVILWIRKERGDRIYKTDRMTQSNDMLIANT